MNQELLCRWLGLSVQQWPPDHYTLLGLRPEEADLPRIERQVQERMAKLRGYQLSHPEEATEGMNRVAQAFIVLTEAAGKKPAASSPRHEPARANGAEKKTPRPRSKEDTAVLEKTQLDWRVAPPPVRGPKTPPSIPVAPKSSPSIPVAKPVAAPPPEPQDLDALARELGQRSDEAISGLGTWVTLFDRIDRTRVLLTAWQRLGLLLRQKKLSTANELSELARQLDAIRVAMEKYPAFLGQPGKPGYRVVALARLSMTADMLRTMTETQRDDLRRDWDTGQRILLAHRRFLREELRAMRRKGSLGLFLRAVRSLVNDHAFYWAVGAVVLLVLVFAYRLRF